MACRHNPRVRQERLFVVGARGSWEAKVGESPTGGPDPDTIKTLADFARELTALREGAGLTIRDVARRAEIPDTTASGYFAGRHLPAIYQHDLFIKIIQACDVMEPRDIQRWVDALVRLRRGHGERNDTPEGASGIFISSRSGTQNTAISGVAERLAKHFGDSQVFRDSVSIPAGSHFPDKLRRALDSCKVLLVAITPEWLDRDVDGRRRIDHDEDWVRFEIATALKSDKIVIPLLIGEALLPSQDDLPPGLRELAHRQAIRIADDSYDRDVQALIESIEQFVPRLVRPVLEQSAGQSTSALIVPGFAGETTSGRDLLGISNDATALAALLTSTSLTPPIALGLFGEWGSGKTFLMRTLERDIVRLAESGASEFCHRVVSVWFNAWHYAESDMWASLLHQIFSSLHGERSTAERLLDEALAKVEGVQEAKAQAIVQVDAARRAAERVRAELEELERQHDAAKASAAEVRTRDVWQTITVDPELRRELGTAIAELGLPEVGQSARELSQAAGDIYSAVQRGRQLATVGTWWKSPLALGLLAAVVVAGLVMLLGAVVEWGNPGIVAAIGQLAVVGAGAAAWLTRQGRLVRRLLEPAERIRREIDGRLTELTAAHREESALTQQDLVDSEATLAAARVQLAEAQAREDEAMSELGQLTGARLLQRYLSERVGSADYQQYLGVIALAHRDLRDLDDHLRSAAADTAVGPLERIVLYVDDLDRCPPETVVRVLEAVHLLLALPLFAVVVGVDAAWLVRSLRDRHPLLLTSNTSQESTEDGSARARPSDYLDKIFQLTYHLPPMTPDRCANLLHQTAVDTQPEPGSGMIVHALVEPAPEFYQPDFGTTSDTGISNTTPVGEAPELNQGRTSIAAAALALDPIELRTLPVIAPLVGSSPRRAKRFLNIYRMSKARALLDADMQQSTPNAMLVLTALVVGLPDSVPAELDRSTPGDQDTLRTWLTALQLQNPAEVDRLSGFLASAGELLELPMKALTPWLSIVRRFAWPVTWDHGESR